MIEQMQILSTWHDEIVDGEKHAWLSVINDYPLDHPSKGVSLTRVQNLTLPTRSTDKVPEPNSAVCRVIGPSEVLDTIEADPNYTVLTGTRGPYHGRTI